MTTSYVPPFMGGLFMPVTPVRQSNSGSVRKWLFSSPEEALQEGMWDLPLCDTSFRNWKFKTYFYFWLSRSFLRMVVQMHWSLENESSSLRFPSQAYKWDRGKKPTKLNPTSLVSNLKELATVKRWFWCDSLGRQPHIVTELQSASYTNTCQS